MQLQQVGFIIALALLTTACAGTNLPASVSGGECKVFPRPEYVVLGKNRYDQTWIDESIESGVAGCRWSRPKARPPSIDEQRTVTVVKRKPSLRQRIKAVIRPSRIEPPLPAPAPWPSTAAPIAPVPPTPKSSAPVETEIVVTPVDPSVDDLLDAPTPARPGVTPPKRRPWWGR